MKRIPIAAAALILVALGLGLLDLGLLDLGTPDRERFRGMVSPRLQSDKSSDTAPTIQAAGPTYVGRQTCLECHRENHRLHSHHGHATTFRSTKDPEVARRFAGKSYDAGEPFGTYTYHVDDQGLFVRIPDKFGDRPFRLEYALGHRSMTLISLLPDLQSDQDTPRSDRDTVALEHRVSWMASEGQLGKTPGQHDGPPQTAAELFGHRHEGRIMHRCVYCHVTTGEIVGQQIVGLTPNVNCEKCHGSASEHVRQARTMKTPPPFSVGRVDWDAESELQLCGDCHRMPRDITRKQLREYPDLLARFQPVGLLRSECFVQSGGSLKCTTCHNPHQSIDETTETEHEQNCIACHDETTPSTETSRKHTVCPVSPTTGCIACHMPALKLDGLGDGFHDHWIRVRDDK
ncbi:Doubled CXXCH motif (Paired_CXXCH_1) [Stieleria maiorica]|uniref:Doubled CXXCH motif (Paired_CXXCH_1) n=1 Tax=Stieleria maiorica TaxID=2795974 RepID=A0A5B9MIE5_9BACT|nr:cytochrome c3 family protein [Stieleria maiorica]QEG00959.1 Doubled CXXCH motif (Paired_CXXCH_1) [Stieleria maiorica]